jgi:hypothetical protein
MTGIEETAVSRRRRSHRRRVRWGRRRCSAGHPSAHPATRPITICWGTASLRSEQRRCDCPGQNDLYDGLCDLSWKQRTRRWSSRRRIDPASHRFHQRVRQGHVSGLSLLACERRGAWNRHASMERLLDLGSNLASDRLRDLACQVGTTRRVVPTWRIPRRASHG